MFRFFANPRLLFAVQLVGYALFFCLVAAIAVPFTFPTRQLRSFVTRQARAQGYPVEIDDLKIRGLSGIELLGVHMTLPAKPGEPGENGAVGPGVPETELHIDRLSASVALWPALMGKAIDVHFEMDAGTGKLEDGRLVKKGEDYDFEIGKLTDLGLGEIGIGNRLLAGNKSLNAGVDGDLNGTAKLHYGAGGEDMSGDVDLELADAILKSPELEGGLRMTDLGLGTVTLKVKIGLKSNIAALAATRGSDKATVIHIEKMEAGGDGADVEILTDETAHILIPPGRGMLKQATLQLHFAINLAEKEKKDVKKAKDGDKAGKKVDVAADDEDAADEEKPEKPVDDRVKWSKILTLFGAKLKPFERAGYIGIGCTGPLLRPQCKPELPVVSVGTRGKAPAGGTGPDGQTPPTGQPTTPGPVQPPVQPVVATPMPPPPPTEFKPVMPPPAVVAAPTPEPAKIEEKKPETAKVELQSEDKKPADDDTGRRGRRGRNADDEEPRAGRDRGNADDEEDRPKRRARDEGDDEKRPDEGGEPQGEERP